MIVNIPFDVPAEDLRWRTMDDYGICVLWRGDEPPVIDGRHWIPVPGTYAVLALPTGSKPDNWRESLTDLREEVQPDVF